MAEYVIDVRVNRSDAVRQIERINRQLRELNQSANLAQRSLSKVFSQRSAASAVRGVNTLTRSVSASSQAIRTFGDNSSQILSSLRQLSSSVSTLNNNVNTLGSSFGRFSQQSRAAERQQERFRQNLNRTSDTARNLRRTVVGLFAGFSTATAVRGAIQLADSYTNIQNRLRTVTVNQQQLNTVTQSLFETSQRTRQSFESIVNLYARVGQSAKVLGLDQQQLLEFVEQVGVSVALSGASAQEATGPLRQLAQALGSNVLRGEEFNSVIEGTPLILDIVADRLGRQRGELRQLASEGKITGQIIVDAFLGGSQRLEELNDLLDRLPRSVSQGAQILSNDLTNAIGTIDSTLMATQRLANGLVAIGDGLSFFSRNIDTISNGFILLSVVAGVRLTAGLRAATISQTKLAISTLRVEFLLGRLTAANTLAAISARLLAIATTALNAALKAVGGPVGLVALAATSLFLFTDSSEQNTAALTKEAKAIDDLAQSLGRLSQQTREQLTLRLGEARVNQSAARQRIDQLRQELEIQRQNLEIEKQRSVINARPGNFGFQVDRSSQQRLSSEISSIESQISQLENSLASGANSIISLQEALSRAGNVVQTFSLANVNASFNDLIAVVNPALIQLNEYNALQKLLTEAQRAGTDIGISYAEAQERLNKAYEDAIDPVGSFIQDTKEQAQFLESLVGKTKEQRDIETELNRLRSQARDKNIEFNEVEARGYVERANLAREQISRQEEAERRAERIRRNIIGDQLEFVENLREINKLEATGQFTAEQAAEARRQNRLEEIQTQLLPRAMGLEQGLNLGLEAQSLMIGTLQQQLAGLGNQVAQIFGPGGSLSQGIGDAVAQSIVFGESFSSALRNIGQLIVSQIISGITQIGINLLLQAAIGQAVGQAATAVGLSQAAALTAAWTPAAIAASIATGGAAAAAGSAAATTAIIGGTSAVLGFSSALSQAGGAGGLGFANGGYVSGAGGPRSDSIPARLSNGEFVVNAEATKRNRALLENINNGGNAGANVSLTMPVTINSNGDIKTEIMREVSRQIDKAQRYGGSLYQFRRA